MSISAPTTTSSSSSSSSSSAATGYQLTSLTSGSPLQITGLASGLNTDSIVTALVATDQQQITNVTNEEDGVNAQSSALTTIQTDLQSLATDADALRNVSLFQDTQTVSSTNPTVVSAALNSSGMGAVQGGYNVTVTQLATSAQATFTYKAGDDSSLMIDGVNVAVTAKTSISSFVQSINNDSSLGVYAAATDSSTDGLSGTVVLSNRSTGQLTDPNTWLSGLVADSGTSSLTGGTVTNGQDAEYTVNNVGGTNSSNTLANAIPGVTLTLSGVTTSTLNGETASSPVTVDVSAPAPSESNVQSAVQTFITAYNSVIGEIQTQLAQTPSSSDPTQGSLYNDEGLSDLLTSMRSAMDATQSTPSSESALLPSLSAGLNNMLDLGVSTGATTGSATPSQSSIDGDLTLDASTLQSALQNNPTGVQNLLIDWATSFSGMVNNQAGPGGVLQSRIQQNDSQASYLATQIANMNVSLQLKETQLETQFADMESALSENQSQSSWLTSQISSLPGY